jgi:antitoxin component of MazEF toxin-antitoxin module
MERKLRVKKRKHVKLVAIGNSKGIRLPKETISKYGFGDSLVMEETDKGLLLVSERRGKLSLKDAAREMASEREDWSDFDVTIADGLGNGG